MKIVPATLKQANEFVRARHRHSKPTAGHKFSVALESSGDVVGVAISGRPGARMAQAWAKRTAEILRVCVVEGAANGCSMLYGASRRALVAMGYEQVITYTKVSESGASLRAAGFRKHCDKRDCTHGSAGCDAFVRAEDWHRDSRPRDSEHHEVGNRWRWVWP